MTQLGFQFHADPDELQRVLLPAWLAGEGPLALAVWLEDEFVERPGYGPPDWCPGGDAALLLVTRRRFHSFHLPYTAFLRANSGFLAVQPGRKDSEGMAESSLGGVTTDREDLMLWRRVIARARRGLRCGAVLVSPSGIRSESPHHRYSEGAEILHRDGLKLLAIAGGNRYELPSSPA